MTSTVFISYAKEDQASAERLYLDLQKAGIQPWLDIIDLKPGQLWDKEIREAISHSAYFIALLSSRSVGKRGHIQKEIRHAINVADEFEEDEIFLVPVRIDECTPSFERLRRLQITDLFPVYEDGLSKLLRLFKYATDEKPELTHVEAFKRRGHIKKLTDRGFGFVNSFPIMEAIVFHCNELIGTSYDDLREGDEITFYLSSGGRAYLSAQEVERM